jgi:hypothetical protein
MTKNHFFRVMHGDTHGGQGPEHRPREARRSVTVQPECSSEEPATLIFIDPSTPHLLSARPNRGLTRCLARMFSSSLDRKLAQGCAPESHRLLAARAQVLVSPDLRRVLADSWTNLVTRARTGPSLRDPRSPLNRSGIVACESEISAMLERLETSVPIRACGVAMASDLLRDGTGPVYDRRRSGDLAIAITAVIERLDPSAPLLS